MGINEISAEVRTENAKALFKQGYNCAQAVALAFADLVDMDESTLSKVCCSFGGGMGQLREVCGAVSGMFVVCGLLYGYDGPETGDVKKTQYKRIQALGKEFESRSGSIICRDLLGLSNKERGDGTPTPRDEKFYKKRTCVDTVGDCAEILANYIAENPIH